MVQCAMLMFEQLKCFIYMHRLCAQMFSAIRADCGSGAQEEAGSSVLDSYCTRASAGNTRT